VNKIYTFKRKLFKSPVSFLAENNVVFRGVVHLFRKTDDNFLLKEQDLISQAQVTGQACESLDPSICNKKVIQSLDTLLVAPVAHSIFFIYLFSFC